MATRTPNPETATLFPNGFIARDYWHISDTSFLGPWPTKYLLRGRRRTTEEFWSGLLLDPCLMPRFAHSVRSAITIATGFGVDGAGASNPLFPTSHTLAICNGPDYVIEVSETMDGHCRRSIDTTIYGIADGMKPCLYFIGNELNVFSADLDSLLDNVASAIPPTESNLRRLNAA